VDENVREVPLSDDIAVCDVQGQRTGIRGGIVMAWELYTACGVGIGGVGRACRKVLPSR
jgi:hypothetical protein